MNRNHYYHISEQSYFVPFCSNKRMRVLYLLYFFALFLCIPSAAQTTVNSYFTRAHHCKQGGKCESYGGDYKQNLVIKLDDSKLQWTKNIFEGFTICQLRKYTENYAVGLKDERYYFADLDSKSIVFIDFVNNRYHTWGYGPNDNEISNRVKMMIDSLANSATQKDVIQALIDQKQTGK